MLEQQQHVGTPQLSLPCAAPAGERCMGGGQLVVLPSTSLLRSLDLAALSGRWAAL